jgi:WD40 repeat protein
MESINHMVRTGFVFFFCTFALYAAENEPFKEQFLIVHVGGETIRLPRELAKNFERLDFSLASGSSVDNQGPIELPSSKVHGLALQELANFSENHEGFPERLNNMDLRNLVRWYNTAAYCVIKRQTWIGKRFNPLDLIYNQLADRFTQNIEAIGEEIDKKACKAINQNPSLKECLIRGLESWATGWSKTKMEQLQVQSITSNPDGTSIIVVLVDGEVKVLKNKEDFAAPLVDCAASSDRVKVYMDPKDTSVINSMRLSPDGQSLAVISNKDQAQLWEIKSGSITPDVLLPHDAPVSVLFFANNKRVVTSSIRNQVTIWDIEKAKRVSDFFMPVTCDHKICFSPDKDLVVALDSFFKISLWNTQNSQFIGDLMLSEPVKNFALSRDGELLAIAFENGNVELWDHQKKERIKSLGRFHDSYFLLFSPDAKQLINSSLSGAFVLTDIQTGACTSCHHSVCLKDPLKCSVFSEDGKTLFTLSQDSDLVLWRRRLDQQKISLGDLEKMPIEAVAALYKKRLYK